MRSFLQVAFSQLSNISESSNYQLLLHYSTWKKRKLCHDPVLLRQHTILGYGQVSRGYIVYGTIYSVIIIKLPRTFCTQRKIFHKHQSINGLEKYFKAKFPIRRLRNQTKNGKTWKAFCSGSSMSPTKNHKKLNHQTLMPPWSGKSSSKHCF